MKYFAVNEDIEKEINSIKRNIMLSMNGICSESMTQMGYNYGKNFGVSLARLRDIAQNYSKNYDLAYRLWLLPIRECKILGTMLCEPGKLTAENLNHWLDGIENPELAETISMYLLSRTEGMTAELIGLLTSDNINIRLAGYHTIARMTTTISTAQLAEAVNLIDANDLDHISAYRAVETIMLQAQEFCDNTIAPHIEHLKQRIKKADRLYAQTILSTTATDSK